MKRSIALTCSALLSLVTVSPATDTGIRLVPYPKRISIDPAASFSLDRSLVLELPAEHANPIGALVRQEFERAGCSPPKIQAAPGTEPRLRLTAAAGAPWPRPALREGAQEEDYWLRVDPDAACVVGHGPQGLLHGTQTLLQLVRANRRAGPALPALEIVDWPSMRWRCYQDDMTRGPSPTRATLDRAIGIVASLKLNLFTYYMEHQFAFRSHPEIGPADGSLAPDDLRHLVEAGRALGVGIVGNQQSFGHFAEILKHERHAPLRETDSLLTPVREGSYRLLDDLYSDVCPLLPHPWFNVCLDETWGLGTGPSAELARRIGVGGVYIRHVRRVRDLLAQKHGKRMMMWGDIILQHPDQIAEIPRDVILLTWGYSPRDSYEDQISPFTRAGLDFLVCPGVSNWNRILPDFAAATTNIQNFVRDGARSGAIGMLNTEWKDDGESLRGVTWHGHAWGAECAWNASATSPHDFNRRIGAVLFGEPGDHFGQAIELLTRAQALPWCDDFFNRRFWDDDLFPRTDPATVLANARATLDIVTPAIRHLEDCRRAATVNALFLDHFLHGARRVERIALRAIDGIDILHLYDEALERAPHPAAVDSLERAAALARANARAHEALSAGFHDLWLAESKPHALDRTLQRYASAIARLDLLADRIGRAAALARRGEPLPAPDEIGIVEAGHARRTRPHRIVQTPLDPGAPWDLPAQARFAIVVDPGPVPRHDLPIEIDLPFPSAAVQGGTRAFTRDPAGSTIEIPAQIDPPFSGKRPRLSAILPGSLAPNRPREVRLYLDAPPPATPLTGAVSTQPGPGDSRWIENDRLRLLLGAEGAHIYRWEIKARQNLDVTMPGERGWAGFGDIAGPPRSSPNTLTPTARGPALVRYRCRDAQGRSREIAVFAGVSWIEVFLGDPTPRYWDFDDPQHFGADGQHPGRFLFSDGTSGPAPPGSRGLAGQSPPRNARWAIKHRDDGLALGMLSPDQDARFKVGPGAAAGGVGIEGSTPVTHLVTLCGILDTPPAPTMERLRATLLLATPPRVSIHAIQRRQN